jgi:hypothetical protein
MHGLDDAWVAMAETRDSSTAGSVEITLSRAIDQVAPLAADRDRKATRTAAMQYVRL